MTICSSDLIRTDSNPVPCSCGLAHAKLRSDETWVHHQAQCWVQCPFTSQGHHVSDSTLGAKKGPKKHVQLRIEEIPNVDRLMWKSCAMLRHGTCVFVTCLVSLAALKRCTIVVTSCYMYIQCFFETQHLHFSCWTTTRNRTRQNLQFLALCQVTMGSLRWRHNSQCHSGSSNPAEALPAWACRDLRRSQWREHFDTSVVLHRSSSTPK